jgi:hypothetical protein
MCLILVGVGDRFIVTLVPASADLVLYRVSVAAIALIGRYVLAWAAEIFGDFADLLDVCSMLVGHAPSVTRFGSDRSRNGAIVFRDDRDPE